MSVPPPQVPNSIAGLPLAGSAQRAARRAAEISQERVHRNAAAARQADEVGQAEQQVPVNQHHADGRRPWGPDVVSVSEGHAHEPHDEIQSQHPEPSSGDPSPTGTHLDITG